MKKFLSLLLFLIIAVSLPSFAQKKELLQATRTIQIPDVPGPLSGIAYDPEQQRLYVTATANNTVEIVDLKAGTHLHTIIGLNEPKGIIYLPEFRSILVANGGDGSCKNFDSYSFQIRKSVTLGENAEEIRYDPLTKRIYVGFGKGAIGLIDVYSTTLLGTVEIADHPKGFSPERATQRIFVNIPAKKQIAVIDRAKNIVERSISLKGIQSNVSMALDETRHRLFIGCRKPAKLLVFNTETFRRIADIPIAQDVGDIQYDNLRQLLYVTCGEGFITVIRQKDADHYSVISKVKTAPGARASVFVQDRNLFFLAVPGSGSRNAEIREYRVKD